MQFPAKITASCIQVAIPVNGVILHWYACGANGRADVRSRDYQNVSDAQITSQVSCYAIKKIEFSYLTMCSKLQKVICFRSRPRRLGARLGPTLTVRVGVRVRFGNSSSNLNHAFNTPHKEVLIWGAIHSTKISGNFGLKLNGSVRSNRKSFEKTGPPFDVVLFSRSDRSECWLNGSRPWLGRSVYTSTFQVTFSCFCSCCGCSSSLIQYFPVGDHLCSYKSY